MDRRQWLDDRQAAVLASYDDEAPDYDANDYPRQSHQSFVTRLVDTCPPGGVVLDAPCGTGRYFPLIAGLGRRVIGVDQSAGMLGVAAERGIADAVHRLTLQALPFEAEFDGAMCVDALENVPPEDWPAVLGNLRRAVRPDGHLYLTVEESDAAAVDAAYESLVASGAPAVHGEILEGDTAGYHYYPSRDKVAGWLTDAALVVVDEGFDQQDGWGYRHLLLRCA